MTLRVGIQQGLRVGINAGLNNLGDLPLALRLRTQAQWLAATGQTLSNLCLCEDASGVLTDEIVPNNLAAVSSPSYEQDTDYPGIVGVSFTNGSGDGFTWGSLFADDGSTSWLAGGISKMPAAMTSGFQLFGRFVDANDRYTLTVTANGELRWRVGDNVAIADAAVAEDHQGLNVAWVAGVNRTDDIAWLATTLGRAEIDISALGAFATSAAADLSVGSFAGGSGAESQVLMRLFRATGAQTELDAAAQSALAATLSQGL